MPNDQTPLTLVVIPCRADNYAYLLHNAATGQTALIDAPEAAPIQNELAKRGWTLSDILITHHHDDHTDGVPELCNGARVIGAAADAHRLPALDLAVSEDDTLTICGENVQIIDVPGHTIGHIAFYFARSSFLCSADSLMALGCGRLFEGTHAQMWASLLKLRALPGDTAVLSGHEYTQSNAKFAQSIDPHNKALTSRIAEIETLRAAGQPTVPSQLRLECETNPFLRADNTDLKKQLGMTTATDLENFTEIRTRKDNF